MIKYPAVRFTLAFIAGILLNEYFTFDLFFIAAAFSLLIITFIYSSFTRALLNNSVSNLIIYLIIFQAGNFNAEVNREKMNLLPPGIIKQKDFTVYGTLCELNLVREDRISYLITADSLSYENVLFKGPLKLLGELHIENAKIRDSVYSALYPGNRIIQKGLFIKGRERRNPGEFDYNKYLRSNGLSGILRSTSPADFSVVSDKKDMMSAFVFQSRKNIDKQIRKLHTPETASLLRGLLLADRSGIDYRVKEEFIDSGVMHILAVSGLHTAYIALIFLVLFGRFNLILRSLLTAAGLICFLFITGLQVSVFRAVVMAVILILSMINNRSTNIFNSLAAAALIILILTPGQIYNAGFQLSFAAVLSIALLYPVLRDLLPAGLHKHPYIRSFFLFIAVSMAAQIGTLPITVYYFDKLSLISIAANIIVIPLAGLVIASAAVTLILSAVPLLPIFYAAANELFAYLIFKSVSISADTPLSFLRINNFSGTDVIIAYLFTGFLFFTIKKTSLKVGLILFFLVLFNISLFTSLDDKECMSDGKLSILMIDVGQGDAFLIRSPGGKTILLDAGQADKLFDRGEMIIMPLLNHLDIEQIDYALITHLDLDHYGGMISLIQEKKIKHLLKAPPDYSPEEEKLENYLKKRGQSFSYYDRSIMILDGLRLYILNDFRDGYPLAGNDASGVIKLSYGETSFLFTGDIQSSGENYYIKHYGNFLASEVLKVSHHGSKSGTSEKFIKFVSPEFAFISAGYKNRFEHPSKEVIKRLTSSGTEILRSDLNGAILLQSDGIKVKQVNWNY